MNSIEQHKRIKEKALLKKSKKMKLSKTEMLAITDEWFFTFPLPVDEIQKIVDKAEEYDIRPSELIRVAVMKEIRKWN